MAARRSLSRSIGKFEPQVVDRPVAIITAFRGEDPLDDNRTRNRELVEDFKERNLGFYPVRGAGQEERLWLFGLVHYLVPSVEESFVVQPRDDRPETDFVSAIQGLLQK